jgi:hypothetical protein
MREEKEKEERLNVRAEPVEALPFFKLCKGRTALRQTEGER